MAEVNNDFLNDEFLNKWASKVAAIMREQDHQQQQLPSVLLTPDQAEQTDQQLQTPVHFEIASILNLSMSQPQPPPPPPPFSPQQQQQQQQQLQQIVSPRPPLKCLTTPVTTTVCVDSSTNMSSNMKRQNEGEEDVEDDDDADIFSDSSTDSDSDPRQLWNDEKRKEEYEELKREYTKHDLCLCNRNGVVIKAVKIYSQNKNNFPVLVYDKRSFNAMYNLSKSLKEKLDLKAKTIQEIYNLNQGINYVKYNSEQRGKRMRSVKRRRKEK